LTWISELQPPFHEAATNADHQFESELLLQETILKVREQIFFCTSLLLVQG